MTCHSEDMAEFDQLLERSSLGSPGARQLRQRIPRSRVEAVLRIAAAQAKDQRSRGPADL
jgi:hypothetical protein